MANGEIELFFVTTLLVILAEFGDKTHLIVISLMIKTGKPYHVAIGSFIGIALVTFIGALLGALLGDTLPINFISIVGGIIFIGIGLAVLIDEEQAIDTADDILADSNTTLLLMLRASMFVAVGEIGDKSQLFVITASAASNPFVIFSAAICGMLFLFMTTAFLGVRLLELIDPKILHIISGVLFVLVGLWLLVSQLI